MNPGTSPGEDNLLEGGIPIPTPAGKILDSYARWDVVADWMRRSALSRRVGVRQRRRGADTDDSGCAAETLRVLLGIPQRWRAWLIRGPIPADRWNGTVHVCEKIARRRSLKAVLGLPRRAGAWTGVLGIQADRDVTLVRHA